MQMKSLKERHAEREGNRKNGPRPVEIVKDEPEDSSSNLYPEEEYKPMRNKGPGASIEKPGNEVKVEGDDTTPLLTTGISPENDRLANAVAANVQAQTKAVKLAQGGEGAQGNGGGKTWKPNA